MLVERVLVASGLHPGEDERTSAADDVHKSAGFLERLDGAAVHAGVDGDEVDAVLGMAADHIEEVLRLDGDEGLLQVADGVVHGNGADHGRRLLYELGAERLGFAAVGQVHDGLGAKLDGRIDLLPLDGFVGKVAGDAQVDVYLGAQALADAFGRQRRVVYIGRDGDTAGGDALADELRAAAFLLGDHAHGGRDLPRAGEIDLCDEVGGFVTHRCSLRWHYPCRFGGSRLMRGLLSACPAHGASKLPRYTVDVAAIISPAAQKFPKAKDKRHKACPTPRRW